MSTPPPTSALVPVAAERSVAIDLVRLLGLTVVVVGHVWAEYPISGYVAVFFVLSGYLWSDKRTLGQEVQNRARILLVPYVAWTLILGGAFLVWLAGVRGVGGREVLYQGARLAWGGEKAQTPLTALWFFTAIFTATVLYRFLRGVSRWWLMAALLLALVVTSLGPVLHEAPFATGTGALAITFVAAGHWLRKHERRVRHPVLLAAGLALVASAALASGLSSRMALKSGDFGTPVVSIVCAVLLCFAALLVAGTIQGHVPARVGSAVTWVVRLSTVIIVLHTVPLWLLPDWPEPVQLVLALALPVVVGAVLLRHPDSRVRQVLMPGPQVRTHASNGEIRS